VASSGRLVHIDGLPPCLIFEVQAELKRGFEPHLTGLTRVALTCVNSQPG
jgi:hypothetical protein